MPHLYHIVGLSAFVAVVGCRMTADSSGVVKFPNLTPGTQYTLDAYTMSGVQTSESLTEVLYTSKFGVQNLLRSHAYMLSLIHI